MYILHFPPGKVDYKTNLLGHKIYFTTMVIILNWPITTIFYVVTSLIVIVASTTIIAFMCTRVAADGKLPEISSWEPIHEMTILRSEH